MSCGNRFQCGLRKPTRFSFQPDKPSNPELHNENQKRLNDLLKAREEQDKIYSFTSKSQPDNNQLTIQNTIDTPLITDSNYTPWKVPQSSYFSQK